MREGIEPKAREFFVCRKLFAMIDFRVGADKRRVPLSNRHRS